MKVEFVNNNEIKNENIQYTNKDKIIRIVLINIQGKF